MKFAPSEADHEAGESSRPPDLPDGLRLMDERLTGKEYLLGEFSIADAALFYVEFWAGVARHRPAAGLCRPLRADEDPARGTPGHGAGKPADDTGPTRATDR